MTTFTDFIVRLLLALHYYSYSCYSWLWWYCQSLFLCLHLCSVCGWYLIILIFRLCFWAQNCPLAAAGAKINVCRHPYLSPKRQSARMSKITNDDLTLNLVHRICL